VNCGNSGVHILPTATSHFKISAFAIMTSVESDVLCIIVFNHLLLYWFFVCIPCACALLSSFSTDQKPKVGMALE